MSERRNEERFIVGDRIFIYNSSPASSFVGKVIDISRTGLSFSYIKGLHASEEIEELGIIVPHVGLFLKNVPFQTISDEIIQNSSSSLLTLRRRNGIFGALTSKQEDALERFIRKYTDYSPELTAHRI